MRRRNILDDMKFLIRAAEGILEIGILTAVFYGVWTVGYWGISFPENFGGGALYLLLAVYALAMTAVFSLCDCFGYGHAKLIDLSISQWISVFLVDVLTFFLLCLIAAFTKKKVLVTIHGIDWKRSKFSGLGNQILKFSEKMVVRYADAIITLCDNDQDYFKEAYGLETTRIPNGFERFPLRSPSVITEKYGLHREDYILFLARIVPEKGLHYLIKAYRQAGIPQKLVIAGGSGHSEGYYREMQALAGDDPNILFTGFVQGETLAELYSNAYLYVLPSDIEGMPMSLLEALGYGRVCLVSDIRENRVDPDNSYFFQKADTDDLREKLKEISRNRKSYAPSQALMCWDEVAQKTLDLYENTKKRR